VDSALVAFTRRDKQALRAGGPGAGEPGEGEPGVSVSRTEVFDVVDAAFAQRRKTLRAALAGWAGSADQAARLLGEAGVDPALRGEAIGVAEYVRIAAAARRARTIMQS
jgi:16S rRNA (adenine1518-N6/adenine1519-N6)-dimethyltransferase